MLQLWQTGVYIHFPPAHNPRLQNKTKAASVNSTSHGNNKGLAKQQERGAVCVCVLAKDLSTTWLKCVKLTNVKLCIKNTTRPDISGSATALRPCAREFSCRRASCRTAIWVNNRYRLYYTIYSNKCLTKTDFISLSFCLHMTSCLQVAYFLFWFKFECISELINVIEMYINFISYRCVCVCIHLFA